MIRRAVIFNTTTGRITAAIVADMDSLEAWEIGEDEQLETVSDGSITEDTHYHAGGEFIARRASTVTPTAITGGFQLVGAPPGAVVKINGRPYITDTTDQAFERAPGVYVVTVDAFPEIPTTFEITVE